MAYDLDIIADIDLLHPNLWELYLSDIEGAGKARYVCKSVTITPFTNFELAQRTVGGNFFLNKTNPVEVSATFYETVDMEVMKMYQSWVSSFYDYTTKVWKKGVNPKKNAVLQLITYEGSPNLNSLPQPRVQESTQTVEFKTNSIALMRDVREVGNGYWQLTGLLPMTYENLTYDYENTETQEVSITFLAEEILFKDGDAIVGKSI